MTRVPRTHVGRLGVPLLLAAAVATPVVVVGSLPAGSPVLLALALLAAALVLPLGVSRFLGRRGL